MANTIGVNYEQLKICNIPHNSAFASTNATDNADYRDAQLLNCEGFCFRRQRGESMRRCDSRGELFQMGIVQSDACGVPWPCTNRFGEFLNAVFAELAAPMHLG